MIEIENVRKSFGPLEVLKGINLTVNKGEVVTIIGGSGSGKSTLLTCINGLGPVDSGKGVIDGTAGTSAAGVPSVATRAAGGASSGAGAGVSTGGTGWLSSGFGPGAGGASCATAEAARPNAIAVRTKGRKDDFMLDRPLDNKLDLRPDGAP